MRGSKDRSRFGSGSERLLHRLVKQCSKVLLLLMVAVSTSGCFLTKLVSVPLRVGGALGGPVVGGGGGVGLESDMGAILGGVGRDHGSGREGSQSGSGKFQLCSGHGRPHVR